MHSTATIVLPVHNVERTLRPEIMRILDLADALGRRLQVAIVDDGSHDGTFEVACELAREFPQVCVLRQPYQRGLGGALEQVRLRLRVDQVVAHDGVAAIDVDELADALAVPDPGPLPAAQREAAGAGRGSRRLAPSVASTPATPLRSHCGRAFRWLRLDEPLMPRRHNHAASRPATVVGRLPATDAECATTFAGSPLLAT